MYKNYPKKMMICKNEQKETKKPKEEDIKNIL